jgi:hypothetical protein
MLNGFRTSAAADLAYAAHVSSLLAKHTRYLAQFHRFTPYYNAKTYHRTIDSSACICRRNMPSHNVFTMPGGSWLSAFQQRRPHSASYMECARSIWHLHDETINIWTHLVACAVFLIPRDGQAKLAQTAFIFLLPRWFSYAPRSTTHSRTTTRL